MSEVYQGASPNARLLAGSLATGEHNGARVGNAFSVSLVTHVVLRAPLPLRPHAARSCSAPDGPIIRHVAQGHRVDRSAGSWWWRRRGREQERRNPPRKAELPDKAKITVPVGADSESGGARAAQTGAADHDSGTAGRVWGRAVARRDHGHEHTHPAVAGNRHGRRRWNGTRDEAMVPATDTGLGPGLRRRVWWRRVSGPGNGVTQPRLLREVKPNYTADAMRAEIQVVVWLQKQSSSRTARSARSGSPNRSTRRSDSTRKPSARSRSGSSPPAPDSVSPSRLLIEIEMSFTLR